jgi:hypothetical protein
MKSLPLNSELESVARRVVWFEHPERALDDPIRFAAYVLTYGKHGDVEVLRRYIGDEGLQEAVLKAPPGIFDGRSWAYWNLKIGRFPTPPMPERSFSSRSVTEG